MSIFTCLGGRATGLPAISPPAPLLSLPTAFSRRAAIFAGAAATGTLAGSAARALVPVVADADRQLVAMAADLCATLDGAACAFDQVDDEADHDRRLDHADVLMARMVALPTTGLAGVRAKAKAYLDLWSYDVDTADLSRSLAEDAERVLEGLAS